MLGWPKKCKHFTKEHNFLYWKNLNSKYFCGKKDCIIAKDIEYTLIQLWLFHTFSFQMNCLCSKVYTSVIEIGLLIYFVFLIFNHIEMLPGIKLIIFLVIQKLNLLFFYLHFISASPEIIHYFFFVFCTTYIYIVKSILLLLKVLI